jgi:hypothetical protein
MKTFLMSTTMLLLIFVMVLTGCSKKTTVSTSTDRYREYSQQLERNRPMNYPVDANLNDNKIVTSEKNIAMLEETLAPVQKTVVIKNEVANPPKHITSIEKENKSPKNNIVNKILIKKLEKKFRKQTTAAPQEATGGLRTGIVLGAVGLLLLITAGFFGPASPIIYVSGAVLFIVGVVLILISVL